MWRLQDSGDESVTIYLAAHPSEQVLQRISQLVVLLRRSLGDWLTDVVPSYCSVTIYYDLMRCDGPRVAARLSSLMEAFEAELSADTTGTLASSEREVELPVYYGREVAPDLERVADFAGLKVEDVIRLHADTEFRVYALGFRPGFAYMGETPEPLQVPRLETPRRSVPRGAVAIAGPQAAVYPCVSPGGWNLIGRCPIALFDLGENPPRVVLQVGDRVRFKPVDKEAFLKLGGVIDE